MSRQQFRTRERQEGKTTYSHFQFVIMNASITTMKRLLGKDYDGAVKVHHKLNMRLSK